MCMYCEQLDELNIVGKEFELQPTTGFKKDRRYSSWILKLRDDKKAGIMIVTDGSNGVYFDIDYCPMCGRRISDGI